MYFLEYTVGNKLIYGWSDYSDCWVFGPFSKDVN